MTFYQAGKLIEFDFYPFIDENLADIKVRYFKYARENCVYARFYCITYSRELQRNF